MNTPNTPDVTVAIFTEVFHQRTDGRTFIEDVKVNYGILSVTLRRKTGGPDVWLEDEFNLEYVYDWNDVVDNLLWQLDYDENLMRYRNGGKWKHTK